MIIYVTHILFPLKLQNFFSPRPQIHSHHVIWPNLKNLEILNGFVGFNEIYYKSSYSYFKDPLWTIDLPASGLKRSKCRLCSLTKEVHPNYCDRTQPYTFWITMPWTTIAGSSYHFVSFLSLKVVQDFHWNPLWHKWSLYHISSVGQGL